MYQYAETVHFLKHPNKRRVPASVDIDLTNACNQDCYYCESSEFREHSPGQQSLNDYISLLNKLDTWAGSSDLFAGTVNTVCFSGGGEPTLFKGYEQVIKHSLDLGFRTSLITNGTNIHQLLSIDPARMAWVGVDMDAGSKDLYENIRKTKHQSIYQQVVESITKLSAHGVAVDIKILLNEYNCTQSALKDMFVMAQSAGARMIYFRPTVIAGQAYDFRSFIPVIQDLSETYQLPVKMALKKFDPRTYNRCHQMYSFLIFCSDGCMYTCCENKGNDRFSLGSWTQNDFRTAWHSALHSSIYNGINTQLCPPCRSHDHNQALESLMQNPALADTLFL